MTVHEKEGQFLQSEPGQDPVIVEGLFRTSPARVFRAFTDPEEVRSWFVPKPGGLVSVEIDLKIGGLWCFVVEKTADRQIHFEGEYLAIDEPTRLQFTWRHVQAFSDGRREATDSSTVTITFTETGKATDVRLRHEAIRTEDGRRGVGGGWSGCFRDLQKLLAE